MESVSRTVYFSQIYNRNLQKLHSFPTFVPDGKGNPTNQASLTDVPFENKIRLFLKFAEQIDAEWVYHFANARIKSKP